MKKLIDKRTYAKETIVIEMSEMKDGFEVRATNKIHDKVLTKEFKSLVEAEAFFSHVVGMQDRHNFLGDCE